MLNQPQQFQQSTFDVAFDPARAPVAPTPRKVVEPDASATRPAEELTETAGPLRMAMEVAGNVVVGSALLAGLLAAPGILGQLAGLI